MAALVAGVIALCPALDADAVKEIIDSALTDVQINAWINIAYYTTLPLSGNLNECGGDAMLCEIIKVLTAHFMTISEGQAKSESVAGEWSITYRGQDGLGLDASTYGQQVKAMDCSGLLAELGMKIATLDVATTALTEDITLPEDDNG